MRQRAPPATDLLALAIFGGKRLGEISGIALVLLIVLGIMIWARWDRGPPQQWLNHQNLRYLALGFLSSDGSRASVVFEFRQFVRRTSLPEVLASLA